MQEWFINSEIAYLHRVISGTMAGSVSATPISQRLFQLGVISQFNMINQNLEKLNNELDLTIKLEGVSIDFDTYLDENYWKENHLFYNEEDIYKSFDIELKEIPLQHEINFMTDYFPNGDKNYNITPELLDTFRTSLYQLCDRNKIGSKEIEYALNTNKCGMKFIPTTKMFLVGAHTLNGKRRMMIILLKVLRNNKH